MGNNEMGTKGRDSMSPTEEPEKGVDLEKPFVPGVSVQIKKLKGEKYRCLDYKGGGIFYI